MRLRAVNISRMHSRIMGVGFKPQAIRSTESAITISIASDTGIATPLSIAQPKKTGFAPSSDFRSRLRVDRTLNIQEAYPSNAVSVKNGNRYRPVLHVYDNDCSPLSGGRRLSPDPETLEAPIEPDFGLTWEARGRQPIERLRRRNQATATTNCARQQRMGQPGATTRLVTKFMTPWRQETRPWDIRTETRISNRYSLNTGDIARPSSVRYHLRVPGR